MRTLESLLHSTQQHQEDDDSSSPNTLLGSLMPREQKKSDGTKLAEKVWEQTFHEKLPQTLQAPSTDPRQG
jgi:hypothetical protein